MLGIFLIGTLIRRLVRRSGNVGGRRIAGVRGVAAHPATAESGSEGHSTAGLKMIDTFENLFEILNSER